VVDAEKGTPIANVMVGYSKAPSDTSRKTDHVEDETDAGEFILGGMGFGITTANGKGEFRFESVAAGKYQLEFGQIGAMTGTGTSEFYGDPLDFEVRGANVEKLELKMHRGASISGVVVLEDAEAQKGLQGLGRLSLNASTMDPRTNSRSSSAGVVAEDGTFRIGGLKPGKATIQPFLIGGKDVALLRIERDGVELQGGIDIQANEQVTGVRVVLTPANCVIRGHVTLQGGSLPPGRILRVTARPFNADPRGLPYSQSQSVDPKGYFEIENLTPGIYEVEVFAFPLTREGGASAKQTVTVSRDAPANVELVLDVSRTDK
jgi:hypothetical protein